MDIPKARLVNQQLFLPRFDTPKEVVGWMGAMQAQDWRASLHAICLRLSHATRDEVEAAFENGDFLRTHVLRPTWHLVLPKDIRWMLELTAPRIKAKARSRERSLGLTEAVFERSTALLEEALRGGCHLPREDLARILEDNGIDTSEYRISHLLMRAELDAVICSGAPHGNKQTYALLCERAPQANRLDRETSLATLATRYFTSHGPATVRDFVWWSGLTTGEARQALSLASGELSSLNFDGQTYYFHSELPKARIPPHTTHRLPAFDEYIIAYADRRAVIASEQILSKAVSSNGVFRPTILRDGIVVGTWKNVAGKVVETSFET